MLHTKLYDFIFGIDNVKMSNPMAEQSPLTLKEFEGFLHIFLTTICDIIKKINTFPDLYILTNNILICTSFMYG